MKLKVGTTFLESPKTVCPKNFYCYQAFPIERGWVLHWDGHSQINEQLQ